MTKAKDKKGLTASAKKPAKKSTPAKPASKPAAKAAPAKKPAAKPAPVQSAAKSPVAKGVAKPPAGKAATAVKSATTVKSASAAKSAKPSAAKPEAKPAPAKPAPAAAKPATAKPAAKKPEPAKPMPPKPASAKTESARPEPAKAAKPEAVKPETKAAAPKPAEKPPAGKPNAVSAAPTRPLPQPVKPMDTKPAGASKIVQPKTAPVKVKVDFSAGDHVVYPTHGVGKVLRIERQSIAGFELDLMVVEFERDKMTVRIPLAKVQSVGIRKLSTPQKMRTALDTLKGRARVKRAMWSRRAQEYEAKINSGDPVSIAEVVRDLHRNAGQPDQSYSERQIYESALDRLVRELAAVERIDEDSAAKKLDKYLKAA